jgi:hypothetical protein
VGESKVIELVLQPASVHEVVQVVDTPSEVTTDRPDRSVVIDRTFVASIPLNVRNPLQLINFSPAVTKGDDGLSGQNVTSESRTNTLRINGAKGSTTDLAVDGATDTTAYYNQTAGIPGVDAVQEYRVYTSAYAPEFGRTSGGMVAYALRSGTDNVHGSLFECLRNSDLDADGFDADKAGQPIAPFRRNQFGGTVGGPVTFPKLYHGRDKTFFFISYEGLRDARHRIEQASVMNQSLPDRAKKAGVILVFHSYMWEHGDKLASYGENRLAMIHPYRTAIEIGIHVAGHSDSTVSAADPPLRIQDMDTRKGENGVGYGINQRVTVEEAIKVWTLDGAYATFEEAEKGSITPGKLADFAVLRKDPRKVPPDAIKDIVVDGTYVGGKNVWQAPRNALAATHHLIPGIDYGDGDEEDNLHHDDR